MEMNASVAPTNDPANAGMNLTSGSATHAGTRRPRARGDGPHLADGLDTVHQTAPRTRGRTGYDTHIAKPKHGDPADAGMNRHQGQEPQDPPNRPRGRGDEPRTSHVIVS